MEAGTHSPWISRVFADLGTEVVVANPRRVQLIAQSTRKNDNADAQTLARLGRIDPKLLTPRATEHIPRSLTIALSPLIRGDRESHRGNQANRPAGPGNDRDALSRSSSPSADCRRRTTDLTDLHPHHRGSEPLQEEQGDRAISRLVPLQRESGASSPRGGSLANKLGRVHGRLRTHDLGTRRARDEDSSAPN